MKKISFLLLSAYFYLYTLFSFHSLLKYLGNFNLIPPIRKFEDFINDVPFSGPILEELLELCTNHPPYTVGILWQDYDKFVQTLRKEVWDRNPYMKFEKFYYLYKNPVRILPQEINKVKYIIKFKGEIQKGDHIIKETNNLILYQKLNDKNNHSR